jgi:hypothetical protein
MLIPLKISNLPMPQPALQKRVLGEGIKPVLVASTARLDFGRTIIAYHEIYPKEQVIELSNPSEKAVSFRVDYVQGASPFSVSCDKNSLQPGDTALIKVTYRPVNAGVSERVLPIVVEGLNENRSYVTITVKGSADYPKILFDRREIILPVVPLGVEAKMTFLIFNDGYENMHITHNIIQDMTNIPVYIKFPEGANLAVTKKTLRVEAGFFYKKPISFTLRLEFYDDENRVYSIPISGTTDNSLLTLHGTERRFQLLVGQYVARPPVEVDQDCEFLTRFLNNTYFIGNPLKEFPSSIVAHDGEELF